jgi:hypothetical protein
MNIALEAALSQAFVEGTGTTLEAVERTRSFRTRQKRRDQLERVYEPNTHRGAVLRLGPSVPGMSFAVDGERVSARQIVKFGRSVSYSPVKSRVDALVEELGERLIRCARTALSPEALEMAKLCRETKDASLQIQILGGMVEMARINRDARRREGPDYTPSQAHSTLDAAFEEHELKEFLPYSFSLLAPHEIPNCLGSAIILAAWAREAGFKFYFGTEILNGLEPFLRFRIEAFNLLLGTLEGITSQEVRAVRQMLKRARLTDQVILIASRDWHHNVVVQLRDKRWYLLDPLSNIGQVLPAEWQVGEADRVLTKYGEVAPGLIVNVNDGGIGRQKLNQYIEAFTAALGIAQQARLKLSDLGSAYMMDDLLERVPELSLLCNLITSDLEDMPEGEHRDHRWALACIMFAWVYKGDTKPTRPEWSNKQQIDRYRKSPAQRKKKWGDLSGQFALTIMSKFLRADDLMDSAMELGNPDYMIGITVLSNLMSWTGNTAAATLLLECSNSQMFWHEALSPIPDLAQTDHTALSIIKLSNSAFRQIPTHPRVAHKLPIVTELLKELTDKEDAHG